jgi:protein-L-isoaspartate(D-aspartate) O-methyltransferase
VDFAAARTNMVDGQLRTNKVTDLQVLYAFETVPREDFVPEARRQIAYVDEDLEIASGRYLIEPMVLARLVQTAAIRPDDVVLEIGSGSGYGSAILSHLAATVVALENNRDLAGLAAAAHGGLGIDNVLAVDGALQDGYPKQAPYSVIVINGAVAEVPSAITDQLADGGHLVCVIQGEAGPGRATLLQRNGSVVSSRVLFDAGTPLLPGFERVAGFVF